MGIDRWIHNRKIGCWKKVTIMDNKLQEKLYKKYPKIFVQKDKPMTETCMCWGLECGDGWYDLLDTLCGLIQWDIDNNGHPQIEATQVKEKFGTLRFYTNGTNERQEGYINFAEYLSGSICEGCGSNSKVTQTKGWIVTLCPKCMKKYIKKQEKK
jgi:hypothetical protein